jgi:broad specificity phosphatase PhoE
VSDLHCPATVLVTGYGDRTQVRALAESLRSRKLARVYTSPVPAAVAAGALAAGALGVESVVVEGLAELSVTEAGEVERGRGALEAIADQHRGETVLVLSDGPEVGLAELTVDAEGWQVLGRGTGR